MHLSAAAASAAADAVCALLNGGALRLYTGIQPATADTAITTQVKLAEVTFGSPAFAPATSGVAIAHAITADSDADASGTATWFRAVTSGGDPVFDGTMGTTTASDGQVSTTAILQHGTIGVTRCVYRQPLSL